VNSLGLTALVTFSAVAIVYAAARLAAGHTRNIFLRGAGPMLVALGTAFGLVLPAFVLFEPPHTGESHGFVLVVLAAAGAALAVNRDRAEAQRRAMVGDVAHELRNPLTNIRSWLEAAQDGLARLDPQLLGLLLEEALLLQHIIDDLRDLAAADAGDLRIHREAVYVNDILDQVAEAHRGAAETAGVRLRAQRRADPEVLLDGARLRQLVGNLVANAVRHTGAGGTVTIRSEVRDGELIIAVADTGTGIAPGDLPKIFDRFWRADDSRTRSTGGSGLGLAIARKLAEAHGGVITVESTLGVGSVFTVRLPLEPAVSGSVRG